MVSWCHLPRRNIRPEVLSSTGRNVQRSHSHGSHHDGTINAAAITIHHIGALGDDRCNYFCRIAGTIVSTSTSRKANTAQITDGRLVNGFVTRSSCRSACMWAASTTWPIIHAANAAVCASASPVLSPDGGPWIADQRRGTERQTTEQDPAHHRAVHERPAGVARWPYRRRGNPGEPSQETVSRSSRSREQRALVSCCAAPLNFNSDVDEFLMDA